MGRVVVSTVGVGRRVERAIAKPVQEFRPELAVYLVTEDSKEKIDEIEDLVGSEIEYELIEIEDKDDFEECYARAKEVLEDLSERGYEAKDVVINFTGGTKPMSGGLLTAAATGGAENIVYVHGKRDESGTVISGREKSTSVSPLDIIADRRKKQAESLFNLYQFKACREIAKDIEGKTEDPEILGTFEGLNDMAKAYSHFDKFEHGEAMEILRELDDEIFEELGVNPYGNKRLLHEELDSPRYSLSHVADLLENARRRGEEGKFDDAAARLYRVLELAAQVRLWKKYRVDSSDVDVKKVPSEHRRYYKKLEGKDGRVSIGLKKSYVLLKRLGDPMGTGFEENGEIEALLYARNNSILAHGLDPISEGSYRDFQDGVENFLFDHFSELKELEEMARFPEIEK